MRLRILVRGRKDAKAARAALERFYGGFNYRVEHLGGLRGEALAAEALSRATPFTIILLPEREAGLIDSSRLPPFTRLIAFKARDLRNLRVEQIASLIDRGRALLRLSASWMEAVGAYVFDAPQVPGGVNADPSLDVFILYSEGLNAMSRLLGVELEGHAIAYVGDGNMHVYHSDRLVGVIDTTLYPPKATLLGMEGTPNAADLDGLFYANRNAIEVAFKTLARWLAEEGGDADLVLVPWSGGKDSTTALLLALEAFGSDKVVAIHVDTGVEFPETEEYVEETAARLGVELVRAEAGLDKAIRGGRGLPARGARWCTGMKLEALARTVRRLASTAERPLVVVGDRDAESRARSRRPPLRLDPYHGLRTVAPIKLLGGSHTLLAPLLRGVKPNPLYSTGFYRIGCFVCPYMSGWERILLEGIRERLVSARPDAADILLEYLAGSPGNYLR